eukprot:6035526-Amphidinium_carterae.1
MSPEKLLADVIPVHVLFDLTLQWLLAGWLCSRVTEVKKRNIQMLLHTCKGIGLSSCAADFKATVPGSDHTRFWYCSNGVRLGGSWREGALRGNP